MNIQYSENEFISKTRKYATELGLDFKIKKHPDEFAGISTTDASAAIAIPEDRIIKSLYFKIKDKNIKLGVILRGSDKVDKQKLRKEWAKIFPDSVSIRNISLANPQDIEEDLGGLSIGGITPIIFSHQGIEAFIDKNLLDSVSVCGSAGTPYYSFEFNPKELMEKTHYHLVNVV